MINFPSNLELVDYEASWYKKLIDFIDCGYKELGYTGLELDTLDDDLEKIEELYSKPSCFKLLINKEYQNIIGSVAVKINPQSKISEIKRVFIDSDYQGQGFGKQLSLWAFDYAKAHGVKLMHIWSGTLCNKAHQLYQKLGAKDLQELRLLGGVDKVEEKHFIKEL